MSQQQFEYQRHEETSVQQNETLQNAGEERTSDYVGAAPLGGQKIYPQQEPRRRRKGFGVLVIVLMVLLLLGASGYISNSVTSKSANLPVKSVQVSGTPTVIINDVTGTVRVHSGSSSSVAVDATAHGGMFSNLSGDEVKMSENADNSVVTIAVSENGSIFDHGNVDLDVTLPLNSSIQSHISAGSLDVNGVSGKMNLKVDAGTLSYENGTLADGSVLQNSAGAISFRGLLAAGGTYTFKNSAGAINLFLQDNPAFTLNASASAGHVNNKFGTNQVGTAPYTTSVDAHTDAGDVNVQQG